MNEDSLENYRRVERSLDETSSELTDAMNESIEKYIKKYVHGREAEVVNSSLAGFRILNWKEADEWNGKFGKKRDASAAFGIQLKRYIEARPAIWEDVSKEPAFRESKGKTYRLKSR